MTVAELIEKLQGQEPTKRVTVHDGHTGEFLNIRAVHLGLPDEEEDVVYLTVKN